MNKHFFRRSKNQGPELSKFLAMTFFLAIDLGLNSSLDTDLFNDSYSSKGKSTNLILGLAGLQIVIEITIFLVLFLAMADTFLFRVGLLGLLVKKFRTVLMIHPVYIALTIATGAYRVTHYGRGKSLNMLWRDDRFVAISYTQKCGASHIANNLTKKRDTR